MKLNVSKILLTFFLLVILAISLFRTVNYAIIFSEQSIQMDFTAYYAAGKSLNSGLSPYVNHILTNWELWDGIASFKHSRFLYPPLVANLFQPLASVPYINAKYIWNFFNLLCYIICFALLTFIFLRNDKSERYKKFNKILVSAILAFNFFPFLALLERGQIDLVTLFFILLGFSFFLKKNKNEFFSGVFFGIATLFKLYSFLLIPFFLVQKKYKVIYGYLTGITVLVLLTIVFSGTKLSYEYLATEAPRIAKFGSSGTPEMQLPVWILQAYLPMTPTSISIIDGRMYLTESISFNSKASFIRLFEVTLPNLFSNSIYSFFVFAVFFLLFLYFKKKNKIGEFENKFIFWQMILIVITLSSPYTWLMNLVWLMPLSFVIVGELPGMIKEKKYAVAVILIAGFILLAYPDNLLVTKNIKIIGEFFKSRFVISEFLLALSLFLILKYKKNSEEIIP
ncbi:MAG: DUF2029 domain-containing protein [Ignavibacteriae bacterium]|nr:DUF2029 domain-containing protein [Ignavibacteriota bacterium]